MLNILLLSDSECEIDQLFCFGAPLSYVSNDLGAIKVMFLLIIIITIIIITIVYICILYKAVIDKFEACYIQVNIHITHCKSVTEILYYTSCLLCLHC